MKLWLVRGIFTTIIVVLLLASSDYALASDNGHNFIWVVALENGLPDEYWDPTLYKISVEEARVVEKKKIAEQGAPGFCYSLPGGDRIIVILKEGIAANGTYVANPTTIDLTIDKNSMRILETKKKQGSDDPQRYRNIVLSDKDKPLNIDEPKDLVMKRDEVFWGTSTTRRQLFMMKNSTIEKRDNLSLSIIDVESLEETESIALNPGDRKLIPFSGVRTGGAVLIKNRYMICLFKGDARLGYFEPGYIMIVDIESKGVKYVAIGSSPASGIAY